MPMISHAELALNKTYIILHVLICICVTRLRYLTLLKSTFDVSGLANSIDKRGFLVSETEFFLSSTYLKAYVNCLLLCAVTPRRRRKVDASSDFCVGIPRDVQGKPRSSQFCSTLQHRAKTSSGRSDWIDSQNDRDFGSVQKFGRGILVCDPTCESFAQTNTTTGRAPIDHHRTGKTSL